jgi:hypothetical protein
MRLALTQSGETLEQLATRVYALDKPSASQLKTATTALSTANPFLRKPEEVPAGTVLEVPEQQGLEGGQAPAPILAGLAADQLRGAIALAQNELSASIDAEIAEGKASAKLARSRELKNATGDVEASDQGTLRLLAGNAEQRVTDAQSLRGFQQHAFTQIAADLDNLIAALGGGDLAD